MKRPTKIMPIALLFFTILFASFFSVSTISALSTASQIVLSQGTIMYNDGTPLLGGWGGVRLVESTRYTNIADDGTRTTPASVVFPGEVASNAEMTMLYLKTHGYNAVRAYWEPPTSQQDPDWGYDSAWLARMIDIAKALDMYIIVDCHGYSDAYQYYANWTATWSNIISTFKDRYTNIIWEPINEPLLRWRDGTHALSGKAAVDQLAIIYQGWIDMCRGLGDTHWIVVSGVEFYNSQPDMVDWYPVVTDPLNKVYYNWHYYYFYDDEPSAWTVSQAQAKADYYFNVITRLIARYNRPYLCTEMGTQSYYGNTPPPDLQYDGASGYSNVSLAFIQRLVTDFDNYSGRIGYMLWPAGDWAKDWPQGWHYGGLYGGMDIWGSLLEYETFH